MCSSDPKKKKMTDEGRPKSTGKAYEELVEDLFMGDSSGEDEEEEKEEAPDDTE